MKEFIKDIDWLELCIPFTILGLLILFLTYIVKEEKIEKEIIKQSEEYTIFKECTEIQGKYYCK